MQDIRNLKWYQIQGLTTPISNTPRKYTKPLSKFSSDSEMQVAPEQKLATSSTAHENFKIASQKVELGGRPASGLVPQDTAFNASRQLASNVNTLQDLKDAVHSFGGCGLKKTAISTVFADGNPSCRVMLVGEAPGANEDIQGIPFCGESGQLLDKIIASIGLSRKENAYITNSVFWRPPGNRKPTEEEMKICLPFLEKHIALINPRVILVVGSVAMYALLNNVEPISKQRGKVFDYTNQYLATPIKTIITFHPSYLLRQPSQKKLCWDDMLFLKKLLMS